jgi:hypothetical protein
VPTAAVVGAELGTTTETIVLVGTGSVVVPQPYNKPKMANKMMNFKFFMFFLFSLNK